MNTLDKNLFWDIDPATLDEEAHAPFIIRRVLSRGDLPDVKWILQRYGKERVASIANTARDLDQKSRNFWTRYFTSEYAPRNA